MTILTLEAPTLDPLILARANGYIVRLVDFESGTWRDTVTDQPDADGTIDTTTLRGAGALSIGLRLIPELEPTSRMVDRLRAFTQGRLRPTITIDHEDGSPVRYATIARAAVTAPINQPTHRDAALVAKVPTGILESAELHTATVAASGSGSAGIIFPVTFPITFPDATPEGSTIVVNAGNVDVYPIMRLYGPWSGTTSISNDDTGEEIVISGETVLVGDYLEIDTRRRTVRYNSVDERGHRVDYPATTWWTLRPGEQRIRFTPGTFSFPAQIQIEWRDGWS